MTGTLVIAYGNPLRSDDGVAWRAAELLAAQDLAPRVDVLARHQLTPELAGPISQADRVLFVDAAADGPAGTIRVIPVEPAFEPPGDFTHHVSPGAVLALAQTLYGHRPHAHVVAVTGACFDHGDQLSPAVSAALPVLLERLRQLVS